MSVENAPASDRTVFSGTCSGPVGGSCGNDIEIAEPNLDELTNNMVGFWCRSDCCGRITWLKRNASAAAESGGASL